MLLQTAVKYVCIGGYRHINTGYAKSNRYGRGHISKVVVTIVQFL